jgi:hypothetical protein
MTAKVIQEGYTTASFNKAGKLQEENIAIVLVQVPGKNGDWMFVVQGSDFCWVKGLPEGEGYLVYKLPLSGAQDSWKQQVEAYSDRELPDRNEKHTFVAAGDKIALPQDNVFIIAE